jgi:multiple sugar transport system substrate-binding protein
VTQTPEPVTISFTFNLSNDRSNEAKYYEGLAEQFNTQYPHITVDIDPTSRSAILLYSDADVLMLPTWSFRDLKAADALLPLDPLIEMDEDFNHSDFFPGLLRAASDEGQIWGIPAGVDPYVMYYNKDLFDLQGVPYPNSEWTWEDFLQSAIALRDPQADVFGYGPAAFGPGAGNTDCLFFIHQNGGNILDDLQNPTQIYYDDPRINEALQWYADLFLLHDVAPTADQAEEAFGGPLNFSIYNGISAGNVGMWIGGFSEHGGRFYYLREWPMEWGMVTLPQGEHPFSFASYTLFTISSQSENPDAAWKWIAFLTEQLPLRLMPARKSVAESDVFKNHIGNEISTVALESIDGVNFLSASMNDEILDGWRTFFDAVGRIVNDNLTLSEALDWAQRETR